MHVHGLPGSLQELLKPLSADITIPSTITDIRQDLGHYLMLLQAHYRRKKISFNHVLAEGAKGEYYLATELQRLLQHQEGHLFNHLQINNQNEFVSGLGLRSFPDHLLVTPACFLYIETKRWSKKYATTDTVKEALGQMRHTRKNIKSFLLPQGITATPRLYLYDDAGSFPADGARDIAIIRSPRNIVDDMKRGSGERMPEYESLVRILGTVSGIENCIRT